MRYIITTLIAIGIITGSIIYENPKPFQDIEPCPYIAGLISNNVNPKSDSIENYMYVSYYNDTIKVTLNDNINELKIFEDDILALWIEYKNPLDLMDYYIEFIEDKKVFDITKVKPYLHPIAKTIDIKYSREFLSNSYNLPDFLLHDDITINIARLTQNSNRVNFSTDPFIITIKEPSYLNNNDRYPITADTKYLADKININQSNLEIVKEVNKLTNKLIKYDLNYANSLNFKHNIVYQVNLKNTFNYKIGLCQDYSVIMISILRQLGIPSRELIGVANIVEGEHSWVEVFVDDKWIIFDPTLGIGPLTYDEYEEIGLPLSILY